MARKGMTTTSPSKLTLAQRRAQVISLRREGWNFKEIAEAVGVSEATAYKDYQKVLADTPVPHLEEFRAEELSRYEFAIRNLMSIALGDDPRITNFQRIQAWNSIRDWSERKAKLLGLDAPEKSLIMSAPLEMIEQMIIQAEAEMRTQALDANASPRAIGGTYSLTADMVDLVAESKATTT